MDKRIYGQNSEEFLYDWDQWNNKANQVSKLKGKIEMSSATGETVVKDLWNVAKPDERKILADLLYKLEDKDTLAFNKQENDEPYAGY